MSKKVGIAERNITQDFNVATSSPLKVPGYLSNNDCGFILLSTVKRRISMYPLGTNQTLTIKQRNPTLFKIL